MTLNQLPFCLVANDGTNTRIIIPGASAGGHDAAFDLGDSARTAAIKRNGTLLDGTDFLEGITQGGSAISTESYGLTTAMVTQSKLLFNQTLYLVMVNLPLDTRITGVIFVQTVQGVYTASNYNGVGLYSYDPSGHLDLIASSTNDGNLWKGTAYNFYLKLFSAEIDLVAGVYWIGILYSASSESTAPQIGGSQDVISNLISKIDLQNSTVTYGAVAGQTSLPSELEMSSVNPVASRYWVGLTAVSAGSEP